MTKNPYLNTLLALAYICFITLGLAFTQNYDKPVPAAIMPLIMLSLLTLSAAFMGMVFFYQPVRMYLDGDKSNAVKLLVRTIISFAAVTAALLLIVMLVF